MSEEFDFKKFKRVIADDKHALVQRRQSLADMTLFVKKFDALQKENDRLQEKENELELAKEEIEKFKERLSKGRKSNKTLKEFELMEKAVEEAGIRAEKACKHVESVKNRIHRAELLESKNQAFYDFSVRIARELGIKVGGRTQKSLQDAIERAIKKNKR